MKTFKVLGLMSGTSLDGLDLCFCHINENGGSWTFNIIETDSISYNRELKDKLKNAIHLKGDELLEFHNTYGEWLGKQAKQFITNKNLEVDFIASHGHTVHHQPEKGFTYQLGSGQHLANSSGQKVICDFRTNDVALGGQGAPFVPIGDQLFFSNYDFCLNLGGISNVSFNQNNLRIAYDIGLANMVLNHITQKIELAYDDKGALAKSGSLNEKLLAQLNDLEYYALPPPKSIGYEWFTDKVLPIIEANNDTVENQLHTAVHHICEKVAFDIKKHQQKENSTLFVTGGGALNNFLIDTLQEKLGGKTEVIVPEKQLIEFKEAVVFALMGALRIENKINVLKSVTGAARDSSSGVLFLPS